MFFWVITTDTACTAKKSNTIFIHTCEDITFFFIGKIICNDNTHRYTRTHKYTRVCMHVLCRRPVFWMSLIFHRVVKKEAIRMASKEGTGCKI